MGSRSNDYELFDLGSISSTALRRLQQIYDWLDHWSTYKQTQIESWIQSSMRVKRTLLNVNEGAARTP